MKVVFSAVAFTAALLFSQLASAQIAGTVKYTGTESGQIFVQAFTESDQDFEKQQATMINPGPFHFDNVPGGTYTVVAFIDANDNAHIDSDEVWTEAGMPVQVPPGKSGIVLDLDTYKPPSSGTNGGDAGSGGGCCAVVDSRPRAGLLILIGLLAGLAMGRRRL